MAHPRMFDEDDPVLARVRAVTLAFPDAAEKVSHGIPAFFTTKVFAYYGGSEKLADGYVRHDRSVILFADPAELPALLEDRHTYVPMYLGVSGWFGFHLDDGTDWEEVAELVETSYRLTAGPRRARRLDERSGP